MTRFPNARHLASWAGMCPGHDDSGGQRLGGKTRKGNRWLCQAFGDVAQVASTMKQTCLAAQYRRIAARRENKRALIAVGHTMLSLVYTVLTRKQSYPDLGASYVETLDQPQVEPRLVRRLERVGYRVS
jgi:transposase